MKYYYLFKPCIGKAAGRQVLTELLHKNAENFIYYDNIETWFELGTFSLPGIKEIDAILDLQTSPNIKLIAFLVSPYKRFFYYYLSSLNIKTIQDFDNFKDSLTVESFVDFWKNRETLSQAHTVNLADLYEDCNGIKIDYALDFDTIVQDLVKIPGLEQTPVDLFDPYQQMLAHYKTVYNDEIKEWIEKTYAKDIQVYGHTF